jgi:4-diphosphocytidyl-2C-methyl-D-erythritol kinase
MDALGRKEVNEGGRYLMNDLYIPAIHLNKDVETAFNEAASFSPLGVTMTGSGSCVLALFETKELCEWAQSRYRGRFRTYVTKTVLPDYVKGKKTAWKNPFVLSEEERMDAEENEL